MSALAWVPVALVLFFAISLTVVAAGYHAAPAGRSKCAVGIGRDANTGQISAWDDCNPSTLYEPQ